MAPATRKGWKSDGTDCIERRGVFGLYGGNISLIDVDSLLSGTDCRDEIRHWDLLMCKNPNMRVNRLLVELLAVTIDFESPLKVYGVTFCSESAFLALCHRLKATPSAIKTGKAKMPTAAKTPACFLEFSGNLRFGIVSTKICG